MFARAGVVGVTVFALGVALAVAYVSHQRDVPMARGLTVTSVGVAGSLLSELGVQVVGEMATVQAFGTTVAVLIIGGWVYLIAHYTGNEWAVERGAEERLQVDVATSRCR